MNSFSKRLFALLSVAALLTSVAFAKEDAHDLVAKSFQQSEIWTGGPTKLVAKVRLPKPGGGEINIDYTVSWAGPDKWRAEWTTDGLQQVTVLNNGKLSFFTNQKAPLVWGDLFESALATLDGANPSGPYSLAPIDWQKAKFESSKKKVNNVDARCLAFGPPTETLCIDPATSHLLTSEGDLVSNEYNDYTTVGTTSYPKNIKVNFAKQLLVQGDLTVTRGDKFAETLFTPPDKSTSIDFPTCNDIATNYSAPHLNKVVEAKMSEAAKKAKKFGVVWVVADVGKDGSVEKATLAGGDPDLNPAAIEAVQQYKYTPYMRCGQGVGFQQLLMVPFKPPQVNKPGDVNVGGR